MQTRIWSRPHRDDQPALLAELAGYKYHQFVPAIQSKASGWKEEHKSTSDEECTYGKFGIAILSKYPILQTHTHRYRRYKRKTLRNTMACLVKLPNSSLIWVVNTHLGCHFVGLEQHQQAQELVPFVRSLDRTDARGVIVCGDFNSPPLYRCIRYMKRQHFHDLWSSHGRGWGGTFPSESRVLGMPFCASKLLRLDYIFILEFIEFPIRCKCVYTQDNVGDCLMASDHVPLCAVLVLEG